MKTINLLSGLVLVTGFTVISCSKSHFNSLPSSVNFKIQATSKVMSVGKDLLASSTANVATSSFDWDTCQMVVSKIELDARKEQDKSGGKEKSLNDGISGSGKDGNSGSGGDHGMNNSDTTRSKFEFTGPVKVDLFNLTSVIGGTNLEPGMFDNISIEIKSFKFDAKSSPLFYLTGNYTNSTGTVKRINIVINQDFEFKIEKTDTLNFSNDITSVIKMNLVLLLNGVTQTELDNADLTNGKLVISSSSNVLLFNMILRNLHESGESEFERD